MALDKAIAAGKERRRQWRDSRRFDGTCRNHGSCSWCESNRLHQRRVVDLGARQEMAEMSW